MWWLNLTDFTRNPIQSLFPVTRVHSQFTPLSDTLLNMWGAMRGFSERLKLWDTLNYICFPIPPPQIFILPKPWFQSMWVAPLYPNFATYNSFSNPWQSIRVHAIRFPLYLSNYLYCSGCRHKFPQHLLTQQGYFLVQVPERQVSPESTQGGLSMCMVLGLDDLVPPLYNLRFPLWFAQLEGLSDNDDNLPVSQWPVELKYGL